MIKLVRIYVCFHIDGLMQKVCVICMSIFYVKIQCHKYNDPSNFIQIILKL